MLSVLLSIGYNINLIFGSDIDGRKGVHQKGFFIFFGKLSPTDGQR